MNEYEKHVLKLMISILYYMMGEMSLPPNISINKINDIIKDVEKAVNDKDPKKHGNGPPDENPGNGPPDENPGIGPSDITTNNIWIKNGGVY